MCGEKFGISCNPSLIGGSPPRVRGKAAWLPFMRITRGITPACAGKSRFHCGVLYPLWDHPRVCGEKALHDGGILPAQGSPPRVRGKVVVSRNLCLLSGITPACAGKSELQALVLSGQRDHPRVCGEKYSLACCFWPASGSPPRVRGKEDTAGSLDAVRGITPACAGKRCAKRLPPCRYGDHPRVCGEKYWRH